eukprot:1881304-Pyramimonas_sp.AAC.1
MFAALGVDVVSVGVIRESAVYMPRSKISDEGVSEVLGQMDQHLWEARNRNYIFGGDWGSQRGDWVQGWVR